MQSIPALITWAGNCMGPVLLEHRTHAEKPFYANSLSRSLHEFFIGTLYPSIYRHFISQYLYGTLYPIFYNRTLALLIL